MFGLGAMLLTSCDQDIVNEIYLPGGGGSVVVTDSTSSKQLQVFTNLEMLHPAVSTRAVDGQWESNDTIGISSTGMMDNMKFTRSGTSNQFVSASTVWFKTKVSAPSVPIIPIMPIPLTTLLCFRFQILQFRVSRKSTISYLLLVRLPMPIQA